MVNSGDFRRTLEPLSFWDAGRAQTKCLTRADGSLLAWMNSTDDHAIEDGERIFECVNGCAGVKNPAAIKEAVQALQDIRAAYQEMFEVTPVAWQTFDNIAEAALKALGGEEPK